MGISEKWRDEGKIGMMGAGVKKSDEKEKL